MRAVIYDAPGSFRIDHLPKPVPGPSEVRLRVEMTGICGTDIHLHEGHSLLEFPVTPGHEVVGVVEAAGDMVPVTKVGERVVVNGNSACGSCDECLRGRPLFCTRFKAIGATHPGGFAEAMIAPAAQCFAAADLELETAVLVEPAACAVHGMDILELRTGADVLVFGAGPSGLLLAQLVLHGGAARVTVAAPTESKLRRARAFGADETVTIERDDSANTVARLRMLAPRGFDVVVDATGASAISQLAIDLLRDGGTALWYGMSRSDERVTISPYEIFRRQLAIKGSFAQIDCFPRALDLLRSGHLQTDGIVTHKFALDTFAEAITLVRTDSSVLKAVIVP